MNLKTLAILASATLSSALMAHEIGHEHKHVEAGWEQRQASSRILILKQSFGIPEANHKKK
jgi:hypothetical protein